MDLTVPDLLDHDPLHECMLADTALTVSLEALDRACGSLFALDQLVQNADKFPQESFESAARPLLNAIMSGTGIDMDDADLSLESVTGMIGSAVKAILAAIQSFFKSLIQFLSNLDVAASWLMRKVVLLERQASASRGKSATQDTVELGRQYRYLKAGRVYVEDSLRLETELKSLKNVVEVIGQQYTSEVNKAGERLPAVVRGKSGQELTTALVSLIKSIPFDSLASKCRMTTAPAERFNRSNAQATPPLLGAKSLFYLKSNLDEKGVRGFRFHGFFYETTGREEPQIDASREFDTLSPAQIGNIPTIVKEILISISKASNASTQSQTNRTKTMLENFVKSQAGESSDLEAIRKTIVTLTYWMANPSRGLYLNAMSVCRAVVIYCNASIKTYR